MVIDKDLFPNTVNNEVLKHSTATTNLVQNDKGKKTIRMQQETLFEHVKCN